MLKLEDAAKAVPLPNEVLVERDERPLTARGIHVPERSRLNRNTSLATIRAVGANVNEVAVGQRVLLFDDIGRQVKFGSREEVVFEAMPPTHFMAIVDTDAIETESEHPLQGLTPSEIAGPDEETETVFDEGEPEAW